MEKNALDFMYKMNAHGVVGRHFAIDAPFLTDPISMKPINYLKAPIEIINLKSFENISNHHKDLLYEQLSSLFMMSHESYIQYQASFFYPQILTSDNCNNKILYGQYGLFAKTQIQQYQVLGFYSGLYATSNNQLEYLLTQYDFLTLGRYGNACKKEGLPVICGHCNGNYMSVINDWRPLRWYEYDTEELKKIKNSSYNSNSIVVQSGDYYFVVYVATKDISANHELITDYGEGYWEREKDVLSEKPF